MATVAAPTTFVELGGVPLLIVSLLRGRATGRALALFFQTPIWWLLLVWALWQAVTLLWSPDVRQGLDEIYSLRWAWTLLLVFPLLRHRRVLILAMAAGFFAGNLSQVAHGLGGALGVEWLRFDRAPMRNSGWWDPVVGGTLLVGALGLHLPAAIAGPGGIGVSPVRMGKQRGSEVHTGGTPVPPASAPPPSRQRWLGAIGSAITLIAIFATGTRGAWLAAIALVVIVGCIAIARAPGVLTLRRIGTGALAAIVLATAVWLVAGGAIGGRVREARAEIARAAEGDYSTFTGQRIMMARWALDAFAARPVGGVGAGGYKAWVWQTLDDEGVPEAERGAGPHAHNMLLHVAATTGAVGVGLFALVWVAGIRAGVVMGPMGRRGPAPPPIGPIRPMPPGYDYGPACALLGLLLAGATDVVHINAQTAAMWLALLSLCPVWRIEGRAALPQTGGAGSKPAGPASVSSTDAPAAAPRVPRP